MTVMLTPVYELLGQAAGLRPFVRGVLPQATVPAIVSLYVLGIVVGMVVALVLRRTAFKGEPVPFIMELPNYRLPGFKTTLMLAWDKAKGL